MTDTRWREHLDNMDYMRQGIGLRGYAQKDPLVEYRTEGQLMFDEMSFLIKQEAVRVLMHAEVEVEQGPDGAGVAGFAPPAAGPRGDLQYGHADAASLEALAAGADLHDDEDAGFPVVEQRHARPGAQRRPQRSLLVRQRQEVQAVPWRLARQRQASRARSMICEERSRRSEPSCTGFVITFDPDALGTRLSELDTAMEAPGFWDDQRAAARVSAERARVQKKIETYEQLDSEAGDLDVYLEMANEDDGLREELESSLGRLVREIGLLQEQALFTGEYDAGPAVVGVHAGAGGTDSQDWAQMLLRMYERWADHRGFKVELLEQTPGEEAGLKSATFTLTGENAYGIMQAEKGVHRLVRLSPFDSAHRRHTSFAQLEVSPLVEDDVDARDRRERSAHRHVPQPGRGRPARQQDRLRRADHAPSHRDRGAVPERAIPAAEQGVRRCAS